MDKKAVLEIVRDAESRSNEIERAFNNSQTSGKPIDGNSLMRWHAKSAKAQWRLANELYLSLVDAVDKSKNKESLSALARRSSNEYMSAFIKALKYGANPNRLGAGHAEEYRILLDALTETGGNPPGSEGGFLAPAYFDLTVGEKQRQFLDLGELSNVIEVTSFQGWRAVELAAPALPLDLLVEKVPMNPLAEEPRFVSVAYELNTYGGFLPVSRNFWGDTPVEILDYLAGWWSKKVALTNNVLVQAVINALAPVPVDLMGAHGAIKTALNKTLDPQISDNAAIFCNQTGYDALDQLVDGNGRPLIDPETGNAFRRPIVRLSDALWPNPDGVSTNIAVGWLQELITYFRRQAYEMVVTSESAEAWRNNDTEVKALLRCDTCLVDPAALVLLNVTL